MKYISLVFVSGILLCAVLSCSLAGKLVEKSLDMTRANSLWSDVPKMDGLSDSKADMPLTLKVLMRTFVNTVINNADDTGKHVSTDWIVYDYSGSETDIKNFYTPDKMKSGGNWLPPEGMETPCMDGKEKGVYGDVCLYQKEENGKQMGLVIIGLPTKEPESPVFVYFIRAETDAEAKKK